MSPSTSANSFRQQYLVPVQKNDQQDQNSARVRRATSGGHPSDPSLNVTSESETTRVSIDQSRDTLNGISPSQAFNTPGALVTADMKYTTAEHESEGDSADENGGFEPIKTAKTNPLIHPDIEPSKMTEEEMFKVLSQRRPNTSGRPDAATTADPNDEQAEIEKLMSRMFGETRQGHLEDEKTRHVGLVFKNLTVKGMGLGASLQGTLGDRFLWLPRLFKSFVSRGAKGATSKHPVRTILDDFTGSIHPGEMLLVLGRPGSGCSTFLKVLANQRSGYVSVDGDVSYGGTDAKIMGKNYRGEIVYNPEADLHYATLSVKSTLSFALKTRTPGKASRNEGESRADYVREFLHVVAKLFWIEHTCSYRG